MKRIKCVGLLAALLIFALLSGCAGDPAQPGPSAPGEKRKIIIDTDVAADDATAILLAAADDSVKILGVTVAAGNVSLKQAADNALMTLEIAGRTDVPVYMGESTPINGVDKPTFSIFGEDGMGDLDMIHPTGKAEEQSAIDFILDTLRDNDPGEIEIICLSPATNLAKCIQKDAEAMRRVKRVWSMGTAGLGIGNATPVAEFNVYKDVDAYQILLDADLPITVIGLDMDTEETFFVDADFEQMKRGSGACQFIEKAFRGLAANNKKDYGYACGDCPDGIAMACALWQDFTAGTIKTKAFCITDSEHCYGQVVFYREGISYDAMTSFEKYNTVLVTAVDKPGFTARAIEVLNRLP